MLSVSKRRVIPASFVLTGALGAGLLGQPRQRQRAPDRMPFGVDRRQRAEQVLDQARRQRSARTAGTASIISGT